MSYFHSIHIPHFQHFSIRRALLSIGDHETEILMTIAIICGFLIAWTFWAVVAR